MIETVNDFWFLENMKLRLLGNCSALVEKNNMDQKKSINSHTFFVVDGKNSLVIMSWVGLFLSMSLNTTPAN